MADTYATQIYDGARNFQIKATDLSDGTGLSAVVLVNASTLIPNPGLHMKIKRIRYSIFNMSVRLQWAATTPVDIAILTQGQDILNFKGNYAGGWPNNAGAGATGNILISTIAAAVNSSFTIELECIKGV